MSDDPYVRPSDELVVRLTGEISEEAPPDDPPVCPACGAVGELMQGTVGGELLVWYWQTWHRDGCAWMSDPESAPY